MTADPGFSGLAGKVGLVTGAASGLGAVVARELLRVGAQVVVVDRDADALEERFGADRSDACRLVVADVSDEADVATSIGQALSAFGRLDLLHNNAGVLGPRRQLADLELEEFERTLRVNVHSAFLFLRAALRHMRDRGGGGAVVTTASIAGLAGSPGLAAYVASKHAIVGLTRTAALEAGAYGVRVNAVCPGAMDTPLLWADTTPEQMAQRMPRVSPLGRVADAAEVAALVLWLLSDHASFVTGAAFPVDGGQTASAG